MFIYVFINGNWFIRGIFIQTLIESVSILDLMLKNKHVRLKFITVFKRKFCKENFTNYSQATIEDLGL